MIRDDKPSHLHRSKGLFLQFVLDMYVKIETERLNYIRTHQKELRVEDYGYLKDAIINNIDANDIGQLSYLPSTHTGSNRYMHKQVLNGLTFSINHGPPDLFMTMTCNPK